jgi:hypothetical protein
MPSFAHTAYVSPSGNDSTGTIDNSSLPFATAQGAYDAVYTAWSDDQTSYYLLQFDTGTYSQYGNINAYADWPSYIWIQGVGADVTGIGNIVGYTPPPALYTGTAGGNLTINSDGSISVQNIASGDGGYATDDGGATGNLNGGNGGSVTLNSVVVIGYLSSGNGGSTDAPTSEGAGTIGGNGGSITINSSAVGANVEAGYGASGGATSSTTYSGNGGSIYGYGQISSTSYSNTSFYAGNSQNSISIGGVDGYAGAGGVIELTGINFSQAFSGQRGQQGTNQQDTSPSYVGVDGCQFYAIYAADGQAPSAYDGDFGGYGGNVYVYNSTGNYAKAGNGQPGSGVAGVGGNAIVYNSTMNIVVAGNGGGGQTSSSFWAANDGGSISFTNSICNDWLYAGQGGNSSASPISPYSQGSGGNISIVSSTIPDGLHGGIAGAMYGSYYDPYERQFNGAYGNFGTITVDGGDPAFSYPFTTPVTYSDELSSSVWDIFVQWKDVNGNYASRLPNSSDNLNIYSNIFYGINGNVGPFYANAISIHNSAAISVSVVCNSATFRDYSSASVANFWLESTHYGDNPYTGSFSGSTEVNFYDNSGCSITTGRGEDSAGTPYYYQFGNTANFYSTNSITNILNFFNSIVTGGISGVSSSPLFQTYNYLLPTASSGNVMISRLLGLPWFINI